MTSREQFEAYCKKANLAAEGMYVWPTWQAAEKATRDLILAELRELLQQCEKYGHGSKSCRALQMTGIQEAIDRIEANAKAEDAG